MLKLSWQSITLSFLVLLFALNLAGCRTEHRAYEACVATCQKVTRCDIDSSWMACVQDCSVEDWDSVTSTCADLFEELHYCVGPVLCEEIQYCDGAYRAVRDECNVALPQISHAINVWRPESPDENNEDEPEDTTDDQNEGDETP